jgi:hypothetical protein
VPFPAPRRKLKTIRRSRISSHTLSAPNQQNGNQGMSNGDLTADHGYQSLLGRISEVYSTGQTRAAQAVNVHLTETYWQIGHDIVEFEQGGKTRAEYGKSLLELSLNYPSTFPTKLALQITHRNSIEIYYDSSPQRAVLLVKKRDLTFLEWSSRQEPSVTVKRSSHPRF